ncbi:MAG: F0F1 ATP synthase subunit A [Mycoplasma sp.]|nr:F0F1 ATP synthase subunit A [Mycoplasma sp.]
MSEFVDNFNNVQPQLVSIVLVTLIITILAIVIYKKVKNSVPTEAPRGVALIAEQYVRSVDGLIKSVAGNKLSPVTPYIFTLLSFMVVGNLMGLIGFEPPNSSYSGPLILGLVAWIGIFVVGIMYHKLRFFKKYLYNPVEILGQFAPLISISFRIFGNMIGGSTIMYLFYHVFGLIWAKIPVIGEVNLLGSLLAPPFHVYFDLFDGIIQGYVFTILTLMYWVLETGEEEVEHAKEKKTKKIVVYQEKQTKQNANVQLA